MALSTAVAARILEALGDAFTQHAGPGLDPLLDGLAAQLAPADERLTLTDGGWAQAFDANLTPDPAWLGRAFGSTIANGTDVEVARDLVLNRAYWRRGTPAAMRSAVQTLLTGTKAVTLFERDTSPWHLTVRVYEAEVLPGVTLADIEAAVASQKPVGIIAACEISPTSSYAHFAAQHGPDYSDVAAAFPTYDDAHTHVPEEGTA